MWVIHLSVHHVQHRHAYLRRSSPVFGPCEGQPTLLTIQLARKLPLVERGLVARRVWCLAGGLAGGLAAGDPIDVKDAVDLAYGLDDVVEVPRVAHLEREPGQRNPVTRGVH